MGTLRWKAPQAAAGWKGGRAATEFSAPCMQEPYAPTSLYYTPAPNVSVAVSAVATKTIRPTVPSRAREERKEALIAA